MGSQISNEINFVLFLEFVFGKGRTINCQEFLIPCDPFLRGKALDILKFGWEQKPIQWLSEAEKGLS